MFLVDRERLDDRRRVMLDGPEGHHATTVRRIGPGETVMLSDGAGRVAVCTVAVAGKDRLDLDVVELRQEPRPQPRFVVVQALPKSDRAELAVETMTEVGVDVIIPWAASRCIAQWRGARGAKALSKWRSTARAAAKQARRAWLPEITELARTPQVTERVAGAAAAAVLDEAATVPIGDLPLPDTGDLVLVVGPEGGLSADEVSAFTGAGAIGLRLGHTVLRTSTAGAIAAAALLARTPRWR